MAIKSQTRQGKWRRANPLRYLCHRFVENALRLGVLERKPCEHCGAEKSEAHHSDYSRPLLVTWLCRKCHVRLHARQRKGAA